MDESTATAILQAITSLDKRLETNKKDQQDRDDRLFEQILSINQNLVGRDACKTFRQEIYNRFDQDEQRIAKVEAVCISYETKREDFVDSSELSKAKYGAIEKSASLIGPLDKRLEAIENRLKILDALTFSWSTVRSNRAVQFVLFSLVSLLIGVWGGRGVDLFDLIEQFGWKSVILGASWIVLAGTCICLVVYIIYNRKRFYSFFGFS
jgi:hypothetical protein